VVMIAWGYRVKYGRACQAKQRAIKLIYYDWVEAYEAFPSSLRRFCGATDKPKPTWF
jgi:hypothetical protein